MPTGKRTREHKADGKGKRRKPTLQEAGHEDFDHEEMALMSLLQISNLYPQKIYVSCEGSDKHGVLVGGHVDDITFTLVSCQCPECLQQEHVWNQVLNLEEFYEHCTGTTLAKDTEYFTKTLASFNPEELGVSSLAEALRQQADRLGGASLVGQQGNMYWSGESEWFLFTIKGYNAKNGKHKIQYASDGSLASIHLGCSPVHMGTEMPQGRPPNLPQPQQPQQQQPAAAAAATDSATASKKASKARTQPAAAAAASDAAAAEGSAASAPPAPPAAAAGAAAAPALHPSTSALLLQSPRAVLASAKALVARLRQIATGEVLLEDLQGSSSNGQQQQQQ